MRDSASESGHDFDEAAADLIRTRNTGFPRYPSRTMKTPNRCNDYFEEHMRRRNSCSCRAARYTYQQFASVVAIRHPKVKRSLKLP